MKTIRALFDRVSNGRKLLERYPDYNLDDGKIHVLFLSSFMNESGYYRMILPALELNKTESHRALVANMYKWDFHKFVDDYDHPVYFQLLQWAHYVVLPAMFTDAEYVVKGVRLHNPNATIIMDIDLNYYELPDYHPESKTLTKSVRNILMDNLALVDVVTAPNNMITKSYNAIAEKSRSIFKYYTDYYPNLLSNFGLEEVPQIFRNSGKKIRIGLLLQNSLPEDLATINSVLKEILEQNKNHIELVIYGWRNKVRMNAKLLEGINITFVPMANTMDFPTCLNKMAIDIGLIPFVDNAYNQSGSTFNRLLDFSSMMVPSVMPATIPFIDKVKDGENGFLASNPEEWRSKINRLINEPELRKEIGQNAYRLVWEQHSYTNARAIYRLLKIFA